jgi:hypothetical protein
MLLMTVIYHCAGKADDQVMSVCRSTGAHAPPGCSA